MRLYWYRGVEQTSHLFAWRSTRVTEMRCSVVRSESASTDPVGRVARVYQFMETPKCALETGRSVCALIISAYQLDHSQFSSAIQSQIMPCPKLVAISCRFKKAALVCTRQFLETANARDELACDKNCTSMVDECVAMPEVQELHNSVKAVGTRAEDAMEHAS
jgi:hypothetical protein